MKKVISLFLILLFIPFLKVYSNTNNNFLLIDYDKCIKDNSNLINNGNIDINVSNINIKLEYHNSLFNIYVNDNIIDSDYLIILDSTDTKVETSNNIVNLDFILISKYIKKESRTYYIDDNYNYKLKDLFIFEYEYTYILDTNYDSNNCGSYYIEYIYLEDDIYYYENSIFVLYNESKVIEINDINIGYYMNLSKEDLINYLDILLPYTYIDINSLYFYSTNVIQSYSFEVILITDYGNFKKEGIINVIDDKEPIINALNTYYGYISDKLSIDDIFKDISSFDEIDLDLTDSIEIIDLDDYESNMDIVGEYNFKLISRDNNLNECVFNTKYIIYDDSINEDIDLVNEELIINDTKYHFKSSTNKLLTRSEIKDILVNLDYYDIDSELLIISDYFDNYCNEGTYEILVDDGNSINSFNIDVTKSDLIETKGENININNKNKYIIISIIVICFIGLIVGIFVIYIKKRKIEIIK